MHFVYVDEMTKVVGAELLRRMNVSMSSITSGDPAMLIRLADDVPNRMTLKEFVERKIASADLQLIAFPHN